MIGISLDGPFNPSRLAAILTRREECMRCVCCGQNGGEEEGGVLYRFRAFGREVQEAAADTKVRQKRDSEETGHRKLDGRRTETNIRRGGDSAL